MGCHPDTIRRARADRRQDQRRQPTTYDPAGDSKPAPAVARVIYAQERLYRMPPHKIVDGLRTTYGVSQECAETDLLAARDQLIASAVAERPAIRAMATLQFKELAIKAAAARQYTAAVAAWREIGKLHGAYEPDKITIVPNESFDLGAIISVLSPSGKAALDVLLEDIERARHAGDLPPRDPEAIEAEIVEGQLELGNGNGN